jgi:hypothetical protein
VPAVAVPVVLAVAVVAERSAADRHRVSSALSASLTRRLRKPQ